MIITIVYISVIIPIVHISGMVMPIVHISGMIIPIVYISGMIPVSIILLNSFKYNGIHKLIVDLIYSLMTQSYPGAV